MNQFAIIFPGQGSQSVGMLADIAAQFGEVKKTFDEASAALGYDLWSLVQNGPAEELDKTEHTQPALLAASYAIWQILQSRTSIRPVILAGHSLGEYTALVCAQTLAFADAVKLVAARGQYMQEAVAPGVGAMAALIGLDEATVAAICREAAQTNAVLSPANFNSVGQIVVAGHKVAVERAIVLAKEQGAKLAVMIPVSVPSHCALMKPAAERLAALLKTIALQAPIFPILNNVDVARYETAASISDGLTRQLYLPVRWVETIQQFEKNGVTHVIECGPGKVLTGLNKRISKNLNYLTTADAASIDSLLKLDMERSA
jgi:[acyl-carrier-protein] S-malonyltransferase